MEGRGRETHRARRRRGSGGRAGICPGRGSPGAGGGGRGLRQMGAQSVHIIIHPGILAGQRVEVTIGTLLPAEGNMKIQAQWARRNMHRCGPPIH